MITEFLYKHGRQFYLHNYTFYCFTILQCCDYLSDKEQGRGRGYHSKLLMVLAYVSRILLSFMSSLSKCYMGLKKICILFECLYHNYPKYLDALIPYHTCPNIWKSPTEYLLLVSKEMLDKWQTVIRCFFVASDLGLHYLVKPVYPNT